MDDCYLGVDGCKGGWVGILINDNGYIGALKAARVTDIITRAQDLGTIRVIGIDIPIGLPTEQIRPADKTARQALKSRGSTIFNTPTKKALEKRNPEASELNRQALGQGVSAQALALGPRILEVADLVQNASQPHDRHIIEVHPELSFAHMGHPDEPDRAEPVSFSKKTWNGIHERLNLLRRNGIELPSDLPDVGGTTYADDILDAAATAWTANRFHLGLAANYPNGAGILGGWRVNDGDTATIWA